MASGDLIPRVYSDFRGVDFRGEEINLVRSPDSLNMWKDYKKTESVRTRPAFRRFGLFGQFSEENPGKINGIFRYRDSVMIHQKNKLWWKSAGIFSDLGFPILDGSEDSKSANDTKSAAFMHKDTLYFKDGKRYWMIGPIDKFTPDIKEVEGYVPTTSIGRKPKGGGTIHEDVNLLTGKRINTFVADGTAEYHLDAPDIDSVDKVKVDGKEVSSDKYSVDTKKGIVTFTFTEEFKIESQFTDGQDNVSIEFTKTIVGDREKIEKCTLLEVFDNRVFFSGNPDYPNYVWHSSLDNPAYCSTLDYYVEGLDTAKITGMCAGNNALWVFKEPSQSNTSIYYHTPTIDAEYGKVYPSVHSNISLGCVGGAINFNDDIIFFSQRGMEGVNGDITTEQAVAHRSSLIDRKLLAKEDTEDYKNMVLIEWEGYLICFVGKKAYLADSRATFTNGDHFEYEWFYWELPEKVTCAVVVDGILCVGTELEGWSYIYTMTPDSVFSGDDDNSLDYEHRFESYWVTPLDKFKHPQYQKTTNKRGCVVEATGDISVYAKTDKTDFELIGEYKDITDDFVCRIKRKKFKDIQLKFHTNTRFSVEQATLECFIGGYIKR
jgi:hypothetical protein